MAWLNDTRLEKAVQQYIETDAIRDIKHRYLTKANQLKAEMKDPQGPYDHYGAFKKDVYEQKMDFLVKEMLHEIQSLDKPQVILQECETGGDVLVEDTTKIDKLTEEIKKLQEEISILSSKIEELKKGAPTMTTTTVVSSEATQKELEAKKRELADCQTQMEQLKAEKQTKLAEVTTIGDKLKEAEKTIQASQEKFNDIIKRVRAFRESSGEDLASIDIPTEMKKLEDFVKQKKQKCEQDLINYTEKYNEIQKNYNDQTGKLNLSEAKRVEMATKIGSIDTTIEEAIKKIKAEHPNFKYEERKADQTPLDWLISTVTTVTTTTKVDIKNCDEILDDMKKFIKDNAELMNKMGIEININEKDKLISGVKQLPTKMKTLIDSKSATAQHVDDQNQKLVTELAKVKMDLKAKEDELEKKRNEFAHDIEELKKQREEIGKKNQELNDAIHVYDQQKEQWSKDTLELQRIRDQGKDIANAKEQIEELNKQKAELTATIEANNKKIATLNQEIEAKNKSKTELDELLEKLKVKYDKIKSLDDEIEIQKGNVEEAKKALEKEREINKELSKLFAAESDHLEDILQVYFKDKLISDIATVLHAESSIVNNIRTKFNLTPKDTAKLEIVHNDIVEKLESAENSAKSVKDLISQIKDIRNDAETHIERIKEMHKELLALNSDVAKLTAQIESLSATNKKLQTDINDFIKKLAACETEKAKLGVDISEKDKLIKELNQKISDKNALLNKVRTSLNKAKNEEAKHTATKPRTEQEINQQAEQFNKLWTEMINAVDQQNKDAFEKTSTAIRVQLNKVMGRGELIRQFDSIIAGERSLMQKQSCAGSGEDDDLREATDAIDMFVSRIAKLEEKNDILERLLIVCRSSVGLQSPEDKKKKENTKKLREGVLDRYARLIDTTYKKLSTLLKNPTGTYATTLIANARAIENGIKGYSNELNLLVNEYAKRWPKMDEKIAKEYFDASKTQNAPYDNQIKICLALEFIKNTYHDLHELNWLFTKVDPIPIDGLSQSQKQSMTFDEDLNGMRSLLEAILGAVKVFVKLRLIPGNEKLDEELIEINDTEIILNHKNDASKTSYSKECYTEVLPNKFQWAGDGKYAPSDANTKIYKQAIEASSNKVFYEKIRNTLEMIDKGYNVIIFGSGYSGSGKTYTLIGKPEKKIDGVLQMFLKEKKPSKIEFYAFEQYGYLNVTPKTTFNDLFTSGNFQNNLFIYSIVNDTIFTTDVNLPPEKLTHNKFSAIMETMFMVKTNELLNGNSNPEQITNIIQKIDRFRVAKDRIRRTINNPDSSRGHLYYLFKIDDGWFTMIDMGGQESPKEILMDYMSMSAADAKKYDRFKAFFRYLFNAESFLYEKILNKLTIPTIRSVIVQACLKGTRELFTWLDHKTADLLPYVTRRVDKNVDQDDLNDNNLTEYLFIMAFYYPKLLIMILQEAAAGRPMLNLIETKITFKEKVLLAKSQQTPGNKYREQSVSKSLKEIYETILKNNNFAVEKTAERQKLEKKEKKRLFSQATPEEKEKIEKEFNGYFDLYFTQAMERTLTARSVQNVQSDVALIMEVGQCFNNFYSARLKDHDDAVVKYEEAVKKAKEMLLEAKTPEDKSAAQTELVVAEDTLSKAIIPLNKNSLFRTFLESFFINDSLIARTRRLKRLQNIEDKNVKTNDYVALYVDKTVNVTEGKQIVQKHITYSPFSMMCTSDDGYGITGMYQYLDYLESLSTKPTQYVEVAAIRGDQGEPGREDKYRDASCLTMLIGAQAGPTNCKDSRDNTKCEPKIIGHGERRHMSYVPLLTLGGAAMAASFSLCKGIGLAVIIVLVLITIIYFFVTFSQTSQTEVAMGAPEGFDTSHSVFPPSPNFDNLSYL